MLGQCQCRLQDVRMDRWHGRVAVVTGGSSATGAAIIRALVQGGLNVVAVARRDTRIQVRMQVCTRLLLLLAHIVSYVRRDHSYNNVTPTFEFLSGIFRKHECLN